jgi:hypothetical protein
VIDDDEIDEELANVVCGRVCVEAAGWVPGVALDVVDALCETAAASDTDDPLKEAAATSDIDDAR